MNSTEFRHINTCESAKEVQNFLRITYEGINVIKVSKFQKLTKQYENLTVDEDKIIKDFYGKFNGIFNTCFNLEKMPIFVVVRKILGKFLDPAW